MSRRQPPATAVHDTRPRHWPIYATLLAITVALLVLLWDWNWFLPLAEFEASSVLGRPVTMSRFDVQLAAHPTLEFDEVSIANPVDSSASSSFMSVRSVRLRIDPGALLNHTLAVDAITVDAPRIDLHRDASGHANWHFPTLVRRAEAWNLRIGELHITDGAAHFTSHVRRADIAVSFRTTTDDDGNSAPTLQVNAHGRLAGAPLKARFSGTSVLAADHRAPPYPMTLEIVLGSTRVQLDGTLPAPLQLLGARGSLTLSGANLSALEALTTIPLPATPAFSLSGDYGYDDNGIHFQHFIGHVGHSDLSGDIDLAFGGARPTVTGTLLSKRLALSDLANLVGLKPPSAKPSSTASRQPVLPDTPMVGPRLRAADVDLHYRAQHIKSSWPPLRQLRAHLSIGNGVLKLDPLIVGIGTGTATLHVKMNGTDAPLHTHVDMELKGIDVASLQPRALRHNASGIVGGRLSMNTTGTSLARMMANGNGDLTLFSTGGPLDATLTGILGKHSAQQILAKLKLPQDTQVDCMVADFDLHRGQLQTRHALATTPQADISATGSTDFRNETLNYRVAVREHQLRLDTLHPPLLISGLFRAPKVAYGDVPLGTRVKAAALAPLQALMPSLGPHENRQTQCLMLLKAVQEPRHTPRRKGRMAAVQPPPGPAGTPY